MDVAPPRSSSSAIPEPILRLAERLAEMPVEDVLRLFASRDEAAATATSQPSPAIAPKVSEALRVLSRRERDVFDLLAKASSHDEVSKQLGISKNTVKSHSKSINRKLGFRSPRELTRFALGLGSPRHPRAR